jgi:hypothetical protein
MSLLKESYPLLQKTQGTDARITIRTGEALAKLEESPAH